MDQEKEILLSAQPGEDPDASPPAPEAAEKQDEESLPPEEPSQPLPEQPLPERPLPEQPLPEQPPPYVAPPPSTETVVSSPPPGYGPAMMGQPPYVAPPPSAQPVFSHPPPGYGPAVIQHPPSQPVYPGVPPPPQVQPAFQMQQSHIAVVSSQPVHAPVHYVQVKPPNHIILSVITMIFFCWVFGLIALLFAIQVDSAWNSGDRQRAQQRSGAARGWSMAGIVFGVVAYIIIVVGTILRVALVT